MTLKEDLKKGKPVLGFEQVKKKIHSRECKKVYVSSNCPEAENLFRTCKAENIEFEQLKETNVELGVLCKKPFSVSALCFLK